MIWTIEGRRSAATSLTNQVGIGSRQQLFVGDLLRILWSSYSLTGSKMDKEESQVGTEAEGMDETDESSALNVSTLFVKKLQNLLASSSAH